MILESLDLRPLDREVLVNAREPGPHSDPWARHKQSTEKSIALADRGRYRSRLGAVGNRELIDNGLEPVDRFFPENPTSYRDAATIEQLLNKCRVVKCGTSRVDCRS